MPFIQDLLQHRSVSIVGMAKNTGKTTCLNHILNRLDEENRKVAVTSIGVDGEERDVLYDTLKPRIHLKKGNLFITSEKHFAEKKLEANVIAVSNRTTALGRLITAEAASEGKVILSGPSNTLWLQECIDFLLKLGADIALVDGALSRMSLASPAVTEAMVLCTGAACSIQLERLIKKVKFLSEMINLPPVSADLYKTCHPAKEGVWVLTEAGTLADKLTDSLFVKDKSIFERINCYNHFFINGVLTDSFLKIVNTDAKLSNIRLIVRDFSRIFVHPATYSRFVRKGGTIEVLQQAKLIAVCTNPVSPEGYHYDAECLQNAVQEELQIPVYDIVQTINQK